MFASAADCVAASGCDDPLAPAASNDAKPKVATAPALAKTRRVMRWLIIFLPFIFRSAFWTGTETESATSAGIGSGLRRLPSAVGKVGDLLRGAAFGDRLADGLSPPLACQAPNALLPPHPLGQLPSRDDLYRGKTLTCWNNEPFHGTRGPRHGRPSLQQLHLPKMTSRSSIRLGRVRSLA